MKGFRVLFGCEPVLLMRRRSDGARAAMTSASAGGIKNADLESCDWYSGRNSSSGGGTAAREKDALSWVE
jgi:hypothetical protein